METLPRTLLIVPCYNESERLQLEEFAKLPPWVSVLFADDGSVDKTKEILLSFCARLPERFFLFSAAENSGKAGVIHAAYEYARSQSWFGAYEWIGFWDADLATPLAEVRNFLIYRQEFTPLAQALFGSRVNRYGAKVRRRPLRHYLSRLFVTATDLWLGIRCYDSQCGAKLFHRNVVDAALGKAFVSKWVFDLEIILRLGAEQIVEVPVQSWRDVPGSKVRLGRDAWRLLGDLWRIRRSR